MAAQDECPPTAGQPRKAGDELWAVIEPAVLLRFLGVEESITAREQSDFLFYLSSLRRMTGIRSQTPASFQAGMRQPAGDARTETHRITG
ncbi:hypothetical protein [Streptomyces sp. enrichment culture]|uniref:hypothetical protein n=1 Tax=Streptomyces sp. enrichment culture TaxID=1795815 RepID=UPI003F57E7C6